MPACEPFDLWGSRIIGAAIVRPSTRPDELLLVVVSAPNPLVLFLAYDREKQTFVVEDKLEISKPIGAREGEFFQGVVVNNEDGSNVVVISIWVGIVTVLDLTGEQNGARMRGGGKRGKVPVDAGTEADIVQARFDLQ